MKKTLLLFAAGMLLTASLSYSQPGTLDPTFGENGIMFTPIGGLDAGANAVAIQKNGKIAAAGYSRDSAYKRTFALIRYTNHGKLDPSFGNKGIVTTYFPRNNGSVANAITIQNDGKIILAGYLTFGYAFALARYLPDGSLDYSFGRKGKVVIDIGSGEDAANAIAIQPDGKIVVTGYTYNNDTSSNSFDIAVMRYKSNGAPDSSFGVNGIVKTDLGRSDMYHPHYDDYGNAVAILPGGKIIVGASSQDQYLSTGFELVRYKSNGAVDSSFGVNGMTRTLIGYGSTATSMMMLPNGKILLAGYTLTIGQGGFTLAQYKKDGILDSSFGSNGIVLASHYSSYGKSVAVQKNGKIVVAGFFGYSNLQKLELMRFTSHGNLDSSFGINGAVFSDLQSDFTSATSRAYNASFAPVVTLEKNGKIVVAGNGKNKFAVVRYNGDPVRGNHFSDNIISNQVLTNTSSTYVFPNPVKDILHLQNLSSSTKTILIFDLNGKVLQQAVTANNNFSFNVSQLPAGMYFVKIDDGEKTATLRFIKE